MDNKQLPLISSLTEGDFSAGEDRKNHRKRKKAEMIRIVREDKLIKVALPLNTKGKIRFKQRHNDYEFGQQINQEDVDISNRNQYIEWQITYSSKTKDEDKINKDLLIDCEYKDLNPKPQIRYPYELGAILLELKRLGVVTDVLLSSLKDEISTYRHFLDNENISTQDSGVRKINNVAFNFFYWKVPLFICNNCDGTFIEVLKEKQQYAYQMQPMVYFCIPCSLLERGSVNNEVSYAIGPENKDSIINLFRVFGCASIKHQHDIIETLNCILNQP